MTTPHHTTDTTTLYRGDALEILPTLPAATAHAIITDPPYALTVGSSSRGSTWGDAMNAAYWFTAWYREAARILRPDGALWTICSWRTLPVIMRAATDAQLRVASVAVWDKRYIGVGNHLRARYELCALMPGPRFRITDRSASDVWDIPTATYKPHGHPAEKPTALVDHILDLTQIPPGGLVVDPFAGSGTTLAAAAARGLHAVGIEASDHWCDVAARRLAAVQPRLSDTDPPTDEGTAA